MGDPKPVQSSPSASIVITTKNRRDDLRTALNSCINQSCSPEIIVVDDGSDDGTSGMIKADFPQVKLVRHEHSTGYIVARNEAASLADSNFIFSIDDDAVFTQNDIVETTLEEFDDDVRIGAVAIPYIDVNKSPEIKQLAPTSDQVHVTDRFIGTAHALRRDLFLQLDGYREIFFHQGEEGDYAIRLLDAGYFVRLGNAASIHHFESPKRDTTRMDLYGRRNDLLFIALNAPFRFLFPMLVAVGINGLRFGFRVGRPIKMLRGVLSGLFAVIRYYPHRSAVSAETFELFRRLKKKTSIPLEDLAESSQNLDAKTVVSVGSTNTSGQPIE